MKKTFFFLLLLLSALTGCSDLSAIPYAPPYTPEQWLTIQPFVPVRFGPLDFILVQPSSTAFVYLLGLVAIAGGLAIFKNRKSGRYGSMKVGREVYLYRDQTVNNSRLWWAAALVLWGLGALSAGTSYQAFSYEIKCAGKALCSWTSWWEVAYLILSAASIDSMVVAGAYAGLVGKQRQVLAGYAFVHAGLYILLVLVGALVLNKFLISFELLLLASTPNILLLFALNTWRYARARQTMDLALLVAWLGLGAVIGIYFLYYLLGTGHTLWASGFWFSENDILHLGLILWMLFLVRVVTPRLADATPPADVPAVEAGALPRQP